MINRQETIDTFCEIVKIDSPSYEEEKMIEYCKNFLDKRGFEVKVIPFTHQGKTTANVYAYKKGTLDGGIILGAHMDVVKPNIGITPVVKKDVITSNGTTVLGGDDKIAIAGIFNAIDEIIKNQLPHRDIELAITSAEEVGVVGAKYLTGNNFIHKQGVIFDAGGRFGGMVTGAPTHDVYDIIIRGTSSHAGISPESGDNAIIKAAKIIPLLPNGRINEQTVANVGTIKGGKATNIVPDEVIIKGEIRSFDTVEVDSKIKKIKSLLLDNLKESDYEIKIEREYECYEYAETHDLVKRVAGAISKTGIEPRYFKTGGGSDANAFNKNGLEIVNVSCGMMKPHSLDEFIYIDDMIKIAELCVILCTEK